MPVESVGYLKDGLQAQLKSYTEDHRRWEEAEQGPWCRAVEPSRPKVLRRQVETVPEDVTERKLGTARMRGYARNQADQTIRTEKKKYKSTRAAKVLIDSRKKSEGNRGEATRKSQIENDSDT
jgi:hypothetical protein